MSPFLTALAGLTHHDARQRDLTAETLGDLLRTGTLDHSDAETTVAALVTPATNDPDVVVQESALHAIAEAFAHYELPLRLFHTLQRQLPAMPPTLLAEYALDILAATHDPNARPTIEAFLKHPEPAVLLAAAQAITELSGRSGL
ncbi:hypothetical protein ACIBJE_21545 [Micromonospora sp. NPDC050187]|uniref:hypothetical protein n=1 Tax=Micromonospora sp. NPDC050187 TaxID=3364277 RepID=UPI0037B558A7